MNPTVREVLPAMPDEPTPTTTPEHLTPAECAALLGDFRRQVVDFLSHLPAFPDWETSALDCLPEPLHWACVAGRLGDDLAGEPTPDKILATVEAGEVGGVLASIDHALQTSQEEKLATLRDVVFNLEDGRRAEARERQLGERAL
jgi:hypothetical protein